MRERLNLCKTIVGIVKNSVGVVSRVKLFLLALFFLFHTTTFAYFPICCGCFLAFLVVAYPDISFFIFLWVRAFSHFTYFGFSTLLFTKNVPQHFIFAISRGTTLHHTIHTLPPTTHKSILWRRFAPEYAFFSFSCVSNSVPLTGSISNSTTYSIIFVFRFQ